MGRGQILTELKTGHNGCLAMPRRMSGLGSGLRLLGKKACGMECVFFDVPLYLQQHPGRAAPWCNVTNVPGTLLAPAEDYMWWQPSEAGWLEDSA